MGCHLLLQRIFLTQGLNPCLPHCRQTLYHLSHQGSPYFSHSVPYKGGRRSKRQKTMRWRKQVAAVMWTKGPKNPDSLQKLEKTDSTLAPPEGANYASTLTLAQWNWFQKYRLWNCKKIHWCCFVLVTSVVSDSLQPMDCSPSGSSVHGILQARILEWVAMRSSGGSSQPRGWTRVSCFPGRFFAAGPLLLQAASKWQFAYLVALWGSNELTNKLVRTMAAFFLAMRFIKVFFFKKKEIYLFGRFSCSMWS